MPFICTSRKNLAGRGNVVRSLLAPISGSEGGPSWGTKASSTEFVIAVHEGNPPMGTYRDWRFATVVSEYRGMYFERWLRSGTGAREFWYLERAYLNLFETIQYPAIQESEYLCLHIDPNLPANAAHRNYKCGPHLHISTAKPPIPHAHIALNRGHVDDVLSSVEKFSVALEHAIHMIKDEIFDAMGT